MSPRGRTLLPAAVALAAVALVPNATRAQEIAIVGGTVHPVSGPPIENATVLIRDGRIVAVGADVAVPDAARRIDARGKVVTPGLFVPYSQLGLVEVDLVGQTRDERMQDDQVTPAFDPVAGLNPRSTLIPFARSGGLTTAVAAPSGGLIAGLASVIDLAGDTPAGMLVARRVAMMADFDEGAAAAVGGSRGAAALRLREALEDARFWAARRAAFDRGESRELTQSRLDLAALQPVLAGEIPLVVEAHRASDILAVLDIAAEFGLRPVILGGTEAWMVAGALAAEAVPVILKPRTSLPSGFERLGARFDNAALLAAAEVPIAFTPFENHRAGEITQEAGNAVRWGLSWEEALRAVTLTPAEIYGVSDRYGSLAPGRVANVVVWSGDPLELSTRAETVLVRGRVMPDWSRQKELLERYRALDDAPRPAYDVPGSR
ncbi:MAG TPA: amidohydrolase family protein [Gemmatimonadota bacterium]|nr:amidohydrolase family protein [Gemmatimonadota bacterium]